MTIDIKVLSTVSALALLFTSSLAHAEVEAQQEKRTPISVGVVYPLATNAGEPNIVSNADISLLYNRVGGVEGGQVGAVAVHSAHGVDGAQIGGVVAVAGGTVRGVQLSAVTNIADRVEGLQLGLVNVGRNVRGLQLGLVNIAEDVDGASIGLISISKNSVHPIAWASNLEYMNAGIKFSNQYVFTMIAAHYGTFETDFDNVGATFAIGGRIPLPARFDLEILGSLTELAPSSKQSADKVNSWIAPQAIAGYSFAQHLRLFAGGGVRLPISVHVGRDVTRPEVVAGVQF